MKRDIKAMLPEELEAVLKELGQPKFRAKQIFSWLNSGVERFEEMTNLPLSLRQKLEEEFFITRPSVLRKQVSK